jgi:hypothetical protein
MIPYDADVIRAQIKGVPLVAYKNDGAAAAINELWKNLKNDIDTVSPSRQTDKSKIT